MESARLDPERLATKLLAIVIGHKKEKKAQWSVRRSLNYVGWKQRKEVAADLKTIYTATTEAEPNKTDGV
jgi:hypothetical protein